MGKVSKVVSDQWVTGCLSSDAMCIGKRQTRHESTGSAGRSRSSASCMSIIEVTGFESHRSDVVFVFLEQNSVS